MKRYKLPSGDYVKYDEAAAIERQRDRAVELMRECVSILGTVYDKGSRGYYSGIGGQMMRPPTDIEQRIDALLAEIAKERNAS